MNHSLPGTHLQSAFAGDHAALHALRREADQAGVHPKQVEHDLLWLADTDHGEGCSGGALALSSGGRLVGYVPLRYRRASLPLRLGEIAAVRLPYATVQLFGEGVLGDGDELGEAALHALAQLPFDFDGVTLEETPTSSAIWRAIERGAASDFLPVERGRGTHHLIELPASNQAYLTGLSSKARNNLRRSAKGIDAAFGRHEIRVFSTVDSTGELLAAVEQVITKTFHYHMLGFDLTTSNATYRKNLETWARHGWLRAYVLFGGDKPLAYVIGYLVERRFQYEQIGYDPDHARLAPGNYLLARIVAELIETGVADVLDFGRGDAEYKQVFGNRSYEEGAMLLTQRTLYARGAAGAERLFAAASRAVAHSFDRLGVKQTIKTFLRRPRRVRSLRGTA
jgi:CelD/BcsL family acetyltransferase involved in cellulose biosynthesis